MATRTWLATCALMLLALAACSGAQDDAPRVRGAGLELTLRSDPETPRVGANALRLELRDASGAPLSGAALEVSVIMHAMGAMPQMGGPASVREESGGRYRADFDLAMGGTWQLEVAATASGGATVRVEGSLTVGTPGVRLVSQSAAPESAPGGEAATSESASAHPGEFHMDPGRVQKVGVRVVTAERRRFETPLRAVGRVVAEETTLADVALKVKGYVGAIEVNAVGNPVERGQVLFRVYSPELYGAQEELLQAVRSAARPDAGERAEALLRAARNRLRLWNVDADDIARIEAQGAPQEQLAIRSPVSGYVVEKSVSQGSAFEPGARLYRIAALGRVWVEADVYESDLAAVATGQRASVELPSLPGRSFEARVAYLYPTLDPATRTGRVRLELPNSDLALRPAMFASVRLYADHGERLVVPHGAVLFAGQRSFVFRALGDGRFRPQQVTTGLRSGEEVEVLSGLEPGDAIVASGTFLVASESRLRAALELW